MDRDSAECLRGISAMLVVFSHAHFYTAELGVLRVLKPFGYVGVSVFFFYSGFGVMKQYMRNAEYMNGFLTKRLKSVYIPYFVAVIFWLLCRLVTDDTVHYKELIQKLLGNLLLVNIDLPFAWYVKAILVWYVLFRCVSGVQKRPENILQQFSL